MNTAADILIGIVLLAVFAAGFALHWIARQDDSRAGRIIGLAAMLAAAAVTVWLSMGHWP